MKGDLLDNPDTQSYLDMTADIVSAFVSNNPIRADDLAALIDSVHRSLKTLTAPKIEETAAATLIPAVAIKKSVTDDYLICLEDGKMFKSLKRHLATSYKMTPEDYRAKWNLPRDYPMVALGYSAKRSELAKEAGLGMARRKRIEAAAAAVLEPANDSAPKKRRAAAKQAAPATEIADAPAAKQPVKRRGRPKEVKSVEA